MPSCRDTTSAALSYEPSAFERKISVIAFHVPLASRTRNLKINNSFKSTMNRTPGVSDSNVRTDFWSFMVRAHPLRRQVDVCLGFSCTFGTGIACPRRHLILCFEATGIFVRTVASICTCPEGTERNRHSIKARNCSVKRHAKIGPIICCLGSYSFIICPPPGVGTIQSSRPLPHSLTERPRTSGLPKYREKINELCGEAKMVAAIFREPQYILFEPSFGGTIDKRRFPLNHLPSLSLRYSWFLRKVLHSATTKLVVPIAPTEQQTQCKDFRKCHD